MKKFHVKFNDLEQVAEVAEVQESGPLAGPRAPGIWLMVRATVSGPLRRIWFSKSEVRIAN